MANNSTYDAWRERHDLRITDIEYDESDPIDSVEADEDEDEEPSLSVDESFSQFPLHHRNSVEAILTLKGTSRRSIDEGGRGGTGEFP